MTVMSDLDVNSTCSELSDIDIENENIDPSHWFLDEV